MSNLPPTIRPVKPQIVATRGLLSGAPTNGTGGLDIVTEYRAVVKFGQYPCHDIRVGLAPGFSIDSNGGGELDMPNDVTCRVALEKISPNYCVKGMVAAQTDVLVKAGATIQLTEPIGMDFTASELAKVQMYQSVASTGMMYLGAINLTSDANTETHRATTQVVTNVGTVGTWSGAGRDTNAVVGSVPIILGTPSINYPSVIGLGDSILANRDDTVGDAFGNHGFIQRGLYTAGPGGCAVPNANFSRAGERASTIGLGGASRRLAFLRYATDVLTNYGTNDIALGGATFAQVQASLVTAWAAMKTRGGRVWQILIIPRTTSTDNWATAANQTPVSGFAVGGIRDQLNTWIKAQAGALIDGYIDLNVYLEDQAHPGAFVTNGTAQFYTLDGIHPSSNGHALATPGITAWGQKITALGLPANF